MEEGVNSGRKSPWNKKYLVTLYSKVNAYCKAATLHALSTEGQQVAMETMAAYNMFKYPVVYVFIHYNFGQFRDLEMSQNDISSYMLFLSMVKQFTKGMMEGMMEQTVFDFDKDNEIAPALIDICREVLYIEDNY